MAGLEAGGPRGLAQQFAAADIDGKIRYRGTEDVNGGTCELVTIDFDTERTTFWLDPAHDYLPRRQKLRDMVIDVFEFQQFRDEGTGDLIWFPSRGANHWSAEYEFVEIGRAHV